MICAIYARVSTRDQSVENQLLELRAFCTRMGWQVYQEYTDQISGSKSEKERPAFRKMFEDAAKRKFDVVLVWSLDCFSREGDMQAMHYVQRLDGCGIGFKSYTEQYLDSTDLPGTYFPHCHAGQARTAPALRSGEGWSRPAPDPKGGGPAGRSCQRSD